MRKHLAKNLPNAVCMPSQYKTATISIIFVKPYREGLEREVQQLILIDMLWLNSRAHMYLQCHVSLKIGTLCMTLYFVGMSILRQY